MKPLPPSSGEATAPSIASAATPTAEAPGIVRAADSARLVRDHRHQNLAMLTSRRGTKNRLARLSGITPSRISLMATGRKPVSNPFALAIESALTLPRGWLDEPHTLPQVPASAWTRLDDEQSHLAESETGIFDKPQGQSGPIAEALAKTILRLSRANRLPEHRAFELLGMLITESESTQPAPQGRPDHPHESL